jgi:hypothetical protein
MAKKTKSYVGDIPFDIWGNQLHYPEQTYVRHLTAEEWDGKDIWIVKAYYEDPKREKVTTFSHEQCGLNIYDKPRKSRWDGDKDTVAEMNQIVWLPNYVFEDTLVYDGYSRGRSAAYFGFKSKTTGRKFTVFLKDFEEGFAHEMVKGEVKGRFTFCKRGSNYGTARIKEFS